MFYQHAVSLNNGLTSHHVTYRPRRLCVRRSGAGLVETAAADSGDGGEVTAEPGFDGRVVDDDDEVEGWIGIVAAAVEQRTANCNALHISAHSEEPRPRCSTTHSHHPNIHTGPVND